MTGINVGVSPSSKSSFIQKRLMRMSSIMEMRSSIRDEISSWSENDENVDKGLKDMDNVGKKKERKCRFVKLK